MSNSLDAPVRRICDALARDGFRSLSDRRLLEQFSAGNHDAFSALVDRHGPLVQSVCRRSLHDAALADDAFQATFILLARKASAIGRPDALAGWLFGAARRIAQQMVRQRERQQRRERHVAQQRPEARESRPWDDLLRVLDEELDRLPERLRAPLVACYLQGRTQDEAARELAWPLITRRRRLAEGRERLRLRLERRGATLPAALIAAAVAPTADAAVPLALRESLRSHASAIQHGGAIRSGLMELIREGSYRRALRL